MENFIRERITQLRLNKGVSEYQMSYDLGHNRSYINNISSGKSMPSMVEFFAICDYLGVTPKDFFDDKRENPALSSELETAIQNLDDESTHLILSLINKINHQKE